MLSILPYDRLGQRERDCDRPFKTYQRPSVSLPSSTYSAAFTPPSFVSSMNIPRNHDYSSMDHMRPPHHHHLDQTSNLTDLSSYHRMSHPSSVKMEADTLTASMRVPVHNMGYPSHTSSFTGSMDLSSKPLHVSSHGHNLPTSTSNLHSPNSNLTSNNSNLPSSTTGPPSNSDSSQHGSDNEKVVPPPKKRPHLVPEEKKDGGYWDKRKKNNESAKRSRDSRRMKEEQIAMRVVYLEQENLQLRTEVSLLKSEIDKLRCMLYNS